MFYKEVNQISINGEIFEVSDLKGLERFMKLFKEKEQVVSYNEFANFKGIIRKVNWSYNPKTKMIKVKYPPIHSYKYHGHNIKLQFTTGYENGCFIINYKLYKIDDYFYESDRDIYQRTGEYAHRWYEGFTNELGRYFLYILEKE